MRARVVVRHSPPFSRRGGCAINKKIPFLSGADGVVNKRSRSLLIDIREAHLVFLFEFTNHPVYAAEEGDLLIEAQPPLLENGGEWACSNHFPLRRSRLLRLCQNPEVVEC